MLKIKIDIPKLGFTIDIPAVMKAAGEALAREESAKFARGVDSLGKPLHVPKDGGQPLNRTGKLLSSIRFRKSKKGGAIRFYGRHDKRRTNAEIAWYAAARGNRFLDVTPAVNDVASKAAQEELDRQAADHRARVEAIGI